MKRLLWLSIVSLIVVFVISGCSNSTAQTTTPGQNSTTAQPTSITSKPAVSQTSVTLQQPSKPPPSSSPVTGRDLRGDVNQDGVVDMGDTLLVEKMILGTIPQDKRADVNGDGSIDMGDTSTIEKIMLGIN